MKKEYRITYNNGNPPQIIRARDISKEENGYMLWNGLDGGVTFLKGTYIEKVELIKYEEVK